jgi:gluconokinase
MIPHMLVLAVDVGTSSARALAFDAAGDPLTGSEGRTPYQVRVTPDGGAELDPDEVVEAVAAAIDACLGAIGARAGEIAGVGISAFWHSLLALDAQQRPLTGAITWADTRAAADAAALAAAPDARARHQRTGAPAHASFWPAKLGWLARTRPDVLAGLPEYLALRLTGRAHASLSMASGTGLLDQRRGEWDAALAERCGADVTRLPAIDDTAAGGLASPWAERWPALARVPWWPAWGDGACSNIGSACADARRVALNVGTSAALRIVRAAPEALPEGLWHYRVDADRHLVGGATSEGGNVLGWCRDVLALPADPAALEAALAASPVDGHGLTCLPFLAGERAPGWRADARAAIAGLSLATGPLEIARALLEAVACRLALIYERLAPLAAPDHRVVASGGALAHSPAWAALIADALGTPLALAPEAEASSRGAALLALQRLGAPPPPERAMTMQIVRPDPARHAQLRAVRARQQQLYESIVGPPRLLRQ